MLKLQLHIFTNCKNTVFYKHLFYTTSIARNSLLNHKTIVSPTQTHTRPWFKSRIIIIGFFLLNSWNLNILPHPGYDLTPRSLSLFRKLLSHTSIEAVTSREGCDTVSLSD